MLKPKGVVQQKRRKKTKWLCVRAVKGREWFFPEEVRRISWEFDQKLRSYGPSKSKTWRLRKMGFFGESLENKGSFKEWLPWLGDYDIHAWWDVASLSLIIADPTFPIEGKNAARDVLDEIKLYTMRAMRSKGIRH